MGGTRRKGRIGRNMKVAGLGLASLGVAGAMTLAGAQVAWAGPGGGGPGGGAPGGGPSPCTGAASPPSQTGCTPESLLYYANSSGEPALTPGQSVSVYYLDERPYAASIVQVLGSSGNVLSSTTPAATQVTGSSILNYSELTAFDTNGGSTAPFPANGPLPSCPAITSSGTAPGRAGVCEDLLTFTIPTSGLTPGDTYTARITAYDYDGNSDQFTLNFTDPTTSTTPVGAVGGALLAVAMGGGLVFVQQRRRRGAARRNATAEG